MAISDKDFNRFKDVSDKIFHNMASIIYGQETEIKMIIAAMFAGGHILLEDMPGTGKTTLALILSRSIKPKAGIHNFRRIQFTPDLLPMDITGSNIYNQKTHEFIFRPGPVFTNILLADELNRASPKVQSALLECMAERRVTVENVTYELEKLFFVIATQNPIETEGTYNLPIAQLDRFFARISLSHISKETNIKILQDYKKITTYEGISPVATVDDIIRMQGLVDEVHIENSLLELIASIIAETRARQDIILVPASPRASIYLLKLAKSWALLNGRTYVEEQDIKDMAYPCLNHRLKFHYTDSEERELRSVIDACFESHIGNVV
jgi:MoxR-like ATPase